MSLKNSNDTIGNRTRDVQCKVLEEFVKKTEINSCFSEVAYTSVSQPPGRDPVPGPGINYTGP